MPPEINTNSSQPVNILLDQKKSSVLKVFLNQKDKQFYLQEISILSKVPIATVHRILQKLIAAKYITQLNVAKFKVYQFNNSPEMAEQMGSIENIIPKDKTIIDIAVARLKTILGINSIILHGEITEAKAGILIIGDNIDNDQVKQVSSELKEKFNFTLLPLVMTQDNFDHMRENDMLKGEIKVLYVKKVP